LSGLQKSIREFLSDDFNLYVVLLAAVLGLYSLAFAPVPEPFSPQQFGEGNASLYIHFFYHPGCPHCKEQVGYNQIIAEEFQEAVWAYHDISRENESLFFSQMLQGLGRNATGVPTTVINKTVIVGFDAKSTPDQIRAAIAAALGKETANGSITPAPALPAPPGTIKLPLLGELDLRQHSLLTLAVVLGFIDGFNPCAMWILIYLISIALTLHDRKRFFLVVGSFLFAEGALYFLIMTAWLNAFAFLGYTRIVMTIVGAIALGWGILSLREFIKNRGEISCQVGDARQKGEIRKEAKRIMSSPLTLTTFAGIVLLAFTINSVEFVCSSAIPVVFTQLLALQNLPWWQTYAYVFIYCLLYMIDDIAVFLLAFFAAGGTLGDKIASYGHAIGAAILIVIGALLLFAPQVLVR